jgi:hypothetical protein
MIAGLGREDAGFIFLELAVVDLPDELDLSSPDVGFPVDGTAPGLGKNDNILFKNMDDGGEGVFAAVMVTVLDVSTLLRDW